MKIYKLLIVLFLWPMGQAMGAAAADSEEEGDPWAHQIVCQYAPLSHDKIALLQDLEDVEDRRWLEKKAQEYKRLYEDSEEMLKDLIHVAALEKIRWFEKMLQDTQHSPGNVKALLKIPDVARVWIQDMTGYLTTTSFSGDLSAWLPLLQSISEPLFAVRNSRKIRQKLDGIFKKFRDSLEEEVPASLTKEYFEALLKSSGSGAVSESEPEWE